MEYLIQNIDQLNIGDRVTIKKPILMTEQVTFMTGKIISKQNGFIGVNIGPNIFVDIHENELTTIIEHVPAGLEEQVDRMQLI